MSFCLVEGAEKNEFQARKSEKSYTQQNIIISLLLSATINVRVFKLFFYIRLYIQNTKFTFFFSFFIFISSTNNDKMINTK